MSHHCRDEHDDHHHHHGEGGHDHSDDITPALQHSLYERIDFDGITTLNEAEFGLGRAIVKKTWAERMNVEPELASDVDEQVIVNVPFTGQVKLHSLLLRTSPAPCAPRTLHLFLNRDSNFDFAAADAQEPTQSFDLAQTTDVQEFPVKRARFGQCRRLTLFFPDNFGDGDEETTRISYLGFKGEWMALGRAPQTIVYEAAPQPGDHKVKGTAGVKLGGFIGGRGRGDGV